MLLLVLCCAPMQAQSTFDTILDNNFHVDAGPPVSLREKTAANMWLQLRQFHQDCLAASLTSPQSSTWFAGVNEIRWVNGNHTMSTPNDPDSAILIVTGDDGAYSSGNPGDSRIGSVDMADSAVYVLGGNGDPLGGAGGAAEAWNLGSGSGIARAYAGAGFDTFDGGYAYAHCDPGKASAFGGPCDDGTGGDADASGAGLTVAVGGDTTGAGCLAGSAWAYSSGDIARSFGGNSIGSGSSGGGASSNGALGEAYGGDGEYLGGDAGAFGLTGSFARGGDSTGSGGTGGYASAGAFSGLAEALGGTGIHGGNAQASALVGSSDARGGHGVLSGGWAEAISTGDAYAQGGNASGSSGVGVGGDAEATSYGNEAHAVGGNGENLGGDATATGYGFTSATAGDATDASGVAGNAEAGSGNNDAWAFGGTCAGTTASVGGDAKADASANGNALAVGGNGMMGGNAEAYAQLDADAFGGFGVPGTYSRGGDAHAETVTGGTYEAWAIAGNGYVGGGGGDATGWGPTGMFYNLPKAGDTGEQEAWN